MTTTATAILIPPDPSVFRVVFLYVGQGESTLLIIPTEGGNPKFLLADINRDATRGGLDVVRMLEDLLPRPTKQPSLDVFLNTHPHNDHFCGVDELRKRITVGEVWHTGFTPSNRHEAAFKEFTALMADVQGAGRRVWEYRGTREDATIGRVVYNVLSPADHTKEEIAELEGEARDCRIHDHCGVLRFGYGAPARHVMLTGDADKTAWKDYIMGPGEYHRDRMPCAVLSGPHHGSRSFFKDNEDDADPYVRHIELMNPTWVVLSAPKRADSPHGHPHEDALQLYRRHVKGGIADNVRVLGDRPECLLYDVYPDGRHVLDTDGGALVDAYPLATQDDEGGGGKKAPTVIVGTRLDRGRPMGRS